MFKVPHISNFIPIWRKYSLYCCTQYLGNFSPQGKGFNRFGCYFQMAFLASSIKMTWYIWPCFDWLLVTKISTKVCQFPLLTILLIFYYSKLFIQFSWFNLGNLFHRVNPYINSIQTWVSEYLSLSGSHPHPHWIRLTQLNLLYRRDFCTHRYRAFESILIFILSVLWCNHTILCDYSNLQASFYNTADTPYFFRDGDCRLFVWDKPTNDNIIHVHNSWI